MSAFTLFREMTTRMLVYGLLAGGLIGGLYGTLLIPVLGTLFGAGYGLLAGLISGLIAGIVISAVTRLYFYPLQDERQYTRVIPIIAALVTTTCIAVVLYIVLPGTGFLIFGIPALLGGAASGILSRRLVGWYQITQWARAARNQRTDADEYNLTNQLTAKGQKP